MARLSIQNLHLHFPIHNAATHSFQLDLLRRLGGRLATHHQIVVVEALRGISLNMTDGARVGVIGHNGSGKTTLLRVMAGVYPPTSGHVLVEGNVTPFTDLALGMDLEATGYENILFRSIFLGMTFRQARDHTQKVAEFSELGDFLNIPVRTYSQGMFLRLAFAISTSVEPEIMIMDEMIGGGDRDFLEKAQRRVRDLAERTKILVIASHNTEILKAFCTQALWMERGQIRQFGPIEDVLNNYCSSK
jgi:ABC-type polysaccharide/polyol phosphate transport system ATPase subunit